MESVPAYSGNFTDADALTNLMNFFSAAAGAGWHNLMPHAINLAVILMIIDIAVNWSLYKGDLRLTEIISKIVKYGFILFLITQLGTINHLLIRSFQMAGLIAAGNNVTSDQAAQWAQPTNLLKTGLQLIGAVKNDAGQYQGLLQQLSSSALSLNFGAILMDIIIMIVVLVSFFMMSVELAICIIEFNIFASIAVILLPFGANKYTSFLFQRSISTVFQFGIKMMVMFFMVFLVQQMVNNQISSTTVIGMKNGTYDPTFGEMITQALIYATLGYLTCKVPTLISGMLSGQPSMSGNGVSNSIASAPAAAARGAASAAGGTAAVLAASRVASSYGPDGKAHGVAVGASLKALGGNLAGMALARNPVGKAVLRGADKGNEAMRAGNAIKNGNWKRMTDEQMNLGYKNANDKGQRLNSAAQQQQTAYDNAKVTNTTKLGADINRSLNNLNRPSSPNPKNTPYNPKK